MLSSSNLSLTRRRFLGLGATAGAALLAGSAGCGGGESLRLPDLSEGRDRRLRIDNWPEYIDTDTPEAPGTVARFAKESGIRVAYDEDYDNQAAFGDGGVLADLSAGRDPGYDLIVPTYWVVDRLVSRGLLEPIPLERIPNHVNVDPQFLEVPWDRGARYHMPWQAGLTGIAWNPEETGGEPVRSIAQLVSDPALRGRVGMVPEMREVVGLLMLTRGQDPSRVDAAQARAALDDLAGIVASGQVKHFAGTEVAELLPNGTFAACLAWSGDVVQLQARYPDLGFAIPDEGGIRWFDSMIIPKGATYRLAAADWMDFVYDPGQAARITAAVQYISPVVGVREELARQGGEAAALARNPILFPDEETRRRLFFWSGLGEATEDELQARFDEITGPLLYGA